MAALAASLAGSADVEPAVERYVVPATEPDAASVDAAAELVRSTPGAIVIGVGGGSALDTAKQAAVVATAPMGVEHYALGANPLPGHRPMIAIPTTAGTGAEVTRTCIVTDRDGRKVWTWGDELLPDLVVLDPASTVTMPTHVTVGHRSRRVRPRPRGRERAAQHRARDGTGTPRPAARRRPPPDRRRRAERPRSRARRCRKRRCSPASPSTAAGPASPTRSGTPWGRSRHVPHGVAVAIGLAAALDWNVDGAPEAYTSAAAALGRPVGELPDLLGRAPVRRSRCRPRSAGFPSSSSSPTRSRPR